MSDRNINTALKDQIACEDFSENVLGFEEVDEAEDEEGDEEEGGEQIHGGNSYYPNDVIPEEDI